MIESDAAFEARCVVLTAQLHAQWRTEGQTHVGRMALVYAAMEALQRLDRGADWREFMSEVLGEVQGRP